ncbi:hypothetical protein EJB05_41085, partial [Eragrostis curvula]
MAFAQCSYVRRAALLRRPDSGRLSHGGQHDRMIAGDPPGQPGTRAQQQQLVPVLALLATWHRGMANLPGWFAADDDVAFCFMRELYSEIYAAPMFKARAHGVDSMVELVRPPVRLVGLSMPGFPAPAPLPSPIIEAHALCVHPHNHPPINPAQNWKKKALQTESKGPFKNSIKR